jgi:hypothetical protein
MPCLHPNTFFLKFDFNVSQFHKIYHFRKYVTIHRVETKFLKKKKKKGKEKKGKRKREKGSPAICTALGLGSGPGGAGS